MTNCDSAFATIDDFTTYWCNTCLADDDAARVNRYLRLAASKIHAALQAQAACDCAPAGWAADYLTELNLVAAVAFYNCPCTRITPEERQAAITYVTDQLTQLRSGQLTICADDSGTEYPAVGWAEYGITDRNQARIIYNRWLRTP